MPARRTGTCMVPLARCSDPARGPGGRTFLIGRAVGGPGPRPRRQPGSEMASGEGQDPACEPLEQQTRGPRGSAAPAGGKRSARGAARACVLGVPSPRRAVAIAGFSRRSAPGAGGWASPGAVSRSHWLGSRGTQHPLPPRWGRRRRRRRWRRRGRSRARGPVSVEPGECGRRERAAGSGLGGQRPGFPGHGSRPCTGHEEHTCNMCKRERVNVHSMLPGWCGAEVECQPSEPGGHSSTHGLRVCRLSPQ